VYNKKGEVLFIFRNGKWDLPKGGIEKGEEIEDTAMREVEEETGVGKLRIVQINSKKPITFLNVTENISLKSRIGSKCFLISTELHKVKSKKVSKK
jgi:8-oxo-dGTP pyrophosphatase MutT (NUDIX family)